MINELLESAAKALTAEDRPPKIIVHNGGTTPIESSRFVKIEKKDDNLNLFFIDGGNAPILNTPSQTVQLVRVATLKYHCGKRAETNRKTFCAIHSTDGNHITTTIIGDTIEIPPIRHEDPDLKIGKHKATLASIGDLTRKAKEIDEASRIAEKSNKGDLIIMDGEIPDDHPILATMAQRMFEKARSKGSNFVALSKTNSATTDTGSSASRALIKIAPVGAWIYDLQSQDDKIRAFAKLHQNARHVFLIESNEKIGQETWSALAGLSNDLAFPGYPHGMIIADQLARVSNQERDAAKLTLLTLAAKFDVHILDSTTGTDAHQILDKMQY